MCHGCGLEDAKKKVDGSLMYAKEDRMKTASQSFFFFLSFLKNGSVIKTAIEHVVIPPPLPILPGV